MKIAVSLRTDDPKVPIGFGISLDLPEPSILYESEYAATIAAPITERWNTSDRRFSICAGPILEVEEFRT